MFGKLFRQPCHPVCRVIQYCSRYPGADKLTATAKIDQISAASTAAKSVLSEVPVAGPVLKAAVTGADYMAKRGAKTQVESAEVQESIIAQRMPAAQPMMTKPTDVPTGSGAVMSELQQKLAARAKKSTK